MSKPTKKPQRATETSISTRARSLSPVRGLLSSAGQQCGAAYYKLRYAEDNYRRINVAIELVTQHYVVSSLVALGLWRGLGTVLEDPEEAGRAVMKKLQEQERAKWGTGWSY